MHVPGAGWASFRAQATVQTNVFILNHDPLGRENTGHIKVLVELRSWRIEARAQIIFFTIGREVKAVNRANVDTGIAFDTQLICEDGLDIAIQAALCLFPCEL